MSAAAVSAVWDHSSPDPLAQLCLLAIAWREMPSGTAEVSQATLAEMTGIPRTTLRRVVDRLLADGDLEIVWSRPGARTRYRINLGANRVTPIDQSGDSRPVHAEQMALPVDNTSGDAPDLSTGGPPHGWPHAGHPMDGLHKKKVRKKEEPGHGPPVEREVIR